MILRFERTFELVQAGKLHLLTGTSRMPPPHNNNCTVLKNLIFLPVLPSMESNTKLLLLAACFLLVSVQVSFIFVASSYCHFLNFPKADKEQIFNNELLYFYHHTYSGYCQELRINLGNLEGLI